MVPTLKGIDIRNILIDQDDKVSILDPGRLKLASREADLSRFIMTYRILYWGSRLFLFIDPDKDAEKAFLKAYYDNSFPASGNVLHFYLIKEQLKHWYTAHESLEMHSYPAVVKRLLAGIYVNPYYIRQLTAELEKIN
jgi:aminoglycoside phosphotransferase (APT) family kinase protein